MPQLEVIATDLNDAIQAEKGGATSIEIIENPALGGLTPNLDIVRQIVDAVSIDTHVIIRPHATSFVYSADDKRTMLESIRQVAPLPITSIVIGGMTPELDFDFDFLHSITNEIEPERITIHRVIDHVNHPFLDLQQLKLTIRRVLCSGAITNVYDGRFIMGEWVQQLGADIHFKCGGGLTFDNIAAVHEAVQAPMYHTGATVRVGDNVDSKQVSRFLALLQVNQKDDP